MNEKHTTRAIHWPVFMAIAALLVCTARPFSAPQSTAHGDEPAADAKSTNDKEAQTKKDKSISLFDGKGLTGWNITKFGNEGQVEVKDGQIILSKGNDMTGITTSRKDLPKSNYEVTFEAMRVEGSDFFVGFTFPVKDGYLSLILGGWGGGLCGLSSIGGMDASENETGGYREFENGKWYRIRLRVTDKRVEAWINDDDRVVNHPIDKRKLDVRLEMELAKPFGFATWRTTGALRKIELKPVSPDAADKPKAAKSP